MNNRWRLRVKAQRRFPDKRFFATIRENGVTRAAFIKPEQRAYYKAVYGENITFWDEER